MASQSTVRSIYRSLLRELPPITSTTSTLPRRKIRFTPAHAFLRQTLTPSSTQSRSIKLRTTGISSEKGDTMAIGKAAQIRDYLKAQRTYAELLERYNPNLRMQEEEERVRLSARRVGFELPKEVK